MKETIPFTKEIDFKNKISAITSISLEHQEKIKEGEITGDFIVFGEYKLHTDTTEKEIFKYRLPFTAIIPEEIEDKTIKIDIEDFTYDIIDETIMKVNIDYTIEGEKKEVRFIEPEIEEIVEIPQHVVEEKTDEIKMSDEPKDVSLKNEDNEYITYYVHIVKENETIEDIIKKYETNIDNLKIYNDITNINIGDKIIIPEKQ